VGGYTVGANTPDALVFGYYDGGRLMYAGRTRNGFTPIVRQQVFKKFRGLAIKECPFANLPEAKSGRWGAGLTAAKMKDCRWLKPVLVAQIEFLEWTGDNHLRHTKFVALRDDKPAEQIDNGEQRIAALRRYRRQAESGRALIGAFDGERLHHEELFAFEPVDKGQRERLVSRVLQPLLRIHVAEVEDLGDVPHVLHVVRHGRAVHEDQIEGLLSQHGNRLFDLNGVHLAPAPECVFSGGE
jgi:hypothetical protein